MPFIFIFVKSGDGIEMGYTVHNSACGQCELCLSIDQDKDPNINSPLKL